MNFFKRLFNNFKNNFKKIVMSFLIAVAAWLFVSIQIFPTIEESIRNIAIETQVTEYMIQNNLRIVGAVESTVDIRIEGKRYDVTDISAEDFYASLDLSSVRSAGTFTVPINVSVKKDSECVILETDPRAVTIEIDEIVTREFTLNATAPAISLPEGYYVDQITATPPTISVTGSASVIDKIGSIEARSAYTGAISESHDTQSEIIIYGTNGAKLVNDDLTLSTENVSVYIPIYKQKELPLTFTYINVPSNFDINSLKYSIQPSTLIVAAPDDSIDFRSSLDIGTIDLSDIKLNQNVKIPISLPEGYKNLSGNNNATITWDIADYGKLDFTVDNINIINKPDNYDVALITNQLVVSVIGPSEVLSTLTAADFYVTANLLSVSLHDGTQDVAVSVQLRGIKQKCWVSGSYKATINATPITVETE